jgi:hypothetical protein
MMSCDMAKDMAEKLIAVQSKTGAVSGLRRH